jgi:hypothetical protein
MGMCHLKIKGAVVPLHFMKMYGGVDVHLHVVYWPWHLVRDELSASHPIHFSAAESPVITH